MRLDGTIAALIPDWPELPSAIRAEVAARCAAFVRAQLRLAPFHIRFGFRVLHGAYAVYALGCADKAAALSSFSALPLPLVAGLERLLRAATMLAYCDDAAVMTAIGEERPALRQQRFRALRAQAAP